MHAVALTPRCRFLASPTGSAHRAPAKHARRCYMRGVQLRSRAAPLSDRAGCTGPGDGCRCDLLRAMQPRRV